MSKSILIAILVVTSVNLRGQINIANSQGKPTSDKNRSEIVITDLDKDNITDSLFYNFQTDSIVFLLSSLDFKPLSIAFSPEICATQIGLRKGIFYVDQSFMRYSDFSSYEFDTKKKDFRLVYYANESLGDAMNDGRGTIEFNLLTGEFTANWDYYDCEQDSLLSTSTINKRGIISPIYLNDSIYVSLPYDSLFTYYKEQYLINNRINCIDSKKLTNKHKELHIDIKKINDISIDSLFYKYGKNLKDYLTPQFKLIPNNSCPYDAKLFLLYQTRETMIYLMSFIFTGDNNIYAVLCVNRETLETKLNYITEDKIYEKIKQINSLSDHILQDPITIK